MYVFMEKAELLFQWFHSLSGMFIFDSLISICGHWDNLISRSTKEVIKGGSFIFQTFLMEITGNEKNRCVLILITLGRIGSE